MILGIGYDMTDVRRIDRTLARYPERFVARVFTSSEQQKCDNRRLRAACYAKRFAAKEACAKALGTGMSRGVFWRDMVVGNDESGAPTLTLRGGAQKCLAERVRQRLGGQQGNALPTIHVTLSDEGHYAVALVIIEVSLGR